MKTPYRILVVDDEQSILKALSMGLSSEDFEVDVAADGTSGIRLGSRQDYDILIADLCLPDMDGLEVIRNIKRTSPEIIPIIITGRGSKESSIEAVRLHVSDYLEKPIDLASVRNSIKRGLEERAINRKTIQKQLGQLVHQINNPLMSIMGSAELAIGELNETEAIKLKQYFNNIINATQRISKLNQELMKAGQSSEGEIEKLDTRSLLEDCLSTFKDLLFLKGVSVEKDLAGLELPARGSRFKFEQIFKNLILNAIASMEGMPKRLLKITGTVDMAVSLMSVHIEDTGCGIPAESLGKIFTPYFTTKENGNGLGLAIAQKLAKELGCNIAVKSRLRIGTIFMVNIPIANV